MDIEQEYISNSEQDTIDFGKKIAKELKNGDIVILSGELGSGKTKFTEGVLTFYGLEDEISSPTFTIVNEYDAPNQKIFHFDLYRLSDIDEFFEIGGEEYFEKGISLIEWGEMLESYLKKRYIKIDFSRDFENENQRKIKVQIINK